MTFANTIDNILSTLIVSMIISFIQFMIVSKTNSIRNIEEKLQIIVINFLATYTIITSFESIYYYLNIQAGIFDKILLLCLHLLSFILGILMFLKYRIAFLIYSFFIFFDLVNFLYFYFYKLPTSNMEYHKTVIILKSSITIKTFIFFLLVISIFFVWSKLKGIKKQKEIYTSALIIFVLYQTSILNILTKKYTNNQFTELKKIDFILNIMKIDFSKRDKFTIFKEIADSNYELKARFGFPDEYYDSFLSEQTRNQIFEKYLKENIEEQFNDKNSIIFINLYIYYNNLLFGKVQQKPHYLFNYEKIALENKY